MAFPPEGAASDWKITPTLSIAETYSDNINLAPAGQERSELVTQISPGVAVSRAGGRLRVSARYALQLLLYASDSERNTSNHQLGADANAELVDNFFFVDASASVSQQNISLFGPLALDNLSRTGNRTEVRTVSVSPYIRDNFGTFASYELRYAHDLVDTGAAGLDSQADRLSLNLKSGPAFDRVGWNLTYRKERIDFNRREDAESDNAAATLSYLLTPRFSVFATYGYEKHRLTATSRPDGSFRSVGFNWAPTNRTNLSASVGKRFFGTTRSLSLTHRTRRTVWDAGYSEDVTTTRSQFVLPATVSTADFLDNLFAPRIPDPILRAQFVEALITQAGLPRSLPDTLNFLTNQFFIQKRGHASVAVGLAKSTAILTVFSSRREALASQTITSRLLGTGDFATSDNIRQIGASLTGTWRFAPLSNANAGITVTRNERGGPQAREDEVKIFTLGVTRQIPPRATGSLVYRHIRADSSEGSAAEYRENAITARLNVAF